MQRPTRQMKLTDGNEGDLCEKLVRTIGCVYRSVNSPYIYLICVA